MTFKKLTKEQKKEESRKRRDAKYAGMRQRLGETLTRKATMLPTAYVTGLLPGVGPVRSSSVAAVLGWGGALLLPGKVGAAFEGIGDAGASATLHDMGRRKRASLPRTSALRNTFFDEVSGSVGAGNGRGAQQLGAGVRAAERAAFNRGQEVGARRAVRAVVNEVAGVEVDEQEIEDLGEGG